MGYGLTLSEALFPQLGPSAPVIASGDWEAGRLALAPTYRSDVRALRHCLNLALRHAFSQARVNTLYATCSRALGRLYRRFGLHAFAEDVPLPGTDKAYTLICGCSEQVSAALSGGRTVPPQ